VQLIRPYVARLIDGTLAEAYNGTLEILSSEGAARVLLDEAQLGPTPLGAVRDLGIGKHRVRIDKDGFLPFQSDVVVNHNETTVLEAHLVDEATLTPWYQKWWVWAAGGAGAAAVATTIVLVTRPGHPAPELVVGHSLP
jgi:hypothetical protein